MASAGPAKEGERRRHSKDSQPASTPEDGERRRERTGSQASATSKGGERVGASTEDQATVALQDGERRRESQRVPAPEEGLSKPQEGLPQEGLPPEAEPFAPRRLSPGSPLPLSALTPPDAQAALAAAAGEQAAPAPLRGRRDSQTSSRHSRGKSLTVPGDLTRRSSVDSSGGDGFRTPKSPRGQLLDRPDRLQQRQIDEGLERAFTTPREGGRREVRLDSVDSRGLRLTVQYACDSCGKPLAAGGYDPDSPHVSFPPCECGGKVVPLERRRRRDNDWNSVESYPESVKSLASLASDLSRTMGIRESPARKHRGASALRKHRAPSAPTSDIGDTASEIGDRAAGRIDKVPLAAIVEPPEGISPTPPEGSPRVPAASRGKREKQEDAARRRRELESLERNEPF